MINKKLHKEVEQQLLEVHDPTYSEHEQWLAWKYFNIDSPIGLSDREYERLQELYFEKSLKQWEE